MYAQVVVVAVFLLVVAPVVRVLVRVDHSLSDVNKTLSQVLRDDR